MDKRLLIGESKYVEYKKTYTKTLLKTVSAYANYHDGWILIGLDDQGNIIGLDDAEEMRLNVENAINDALEPIPYYEMETEWIDGKSIVLLKVYKGEHTPYSVNNRTYRRADTSSIQVDRMSHQELILLGRNQTFETMKIENGDLSFQVLSTRLRKALNIQKATEDLLKTLELFDGTRYNRAALMLSDDNSLDSAKILLVAYRDETVLQIKDRIEVGGGSIIQQYDKCMDFYEKHINIGEVIEGAYRKTIEEIPLVAYREAIANAIVHRDYSRQASIRVEVFSDRIEIVSPGTLPVGLSEEEFRSGNISILRNRIIADVFLRLKIIEKIGTGILRIKGYYQGYDVQPSLQVYENSIKVVLPKVNAKRDFRETSESYVRAGLKENENRILQLLEKKKAMNRQEIERALGLKRTQTGDLLKRLREMNLVTKVGSGAYVKYQLRSNR